MKNDRRETEEPAKQKSPSIATIKPISFFCWVREKNAQQWPVRTRKPSVRNGRGRSHLMGIMDEWGSAKECGGCALARQKRHLPFWFFPVGIRSSRSEEARPGDTKTLDERVFWEGGLHDTNVHWARKAANAFVGLLWCAWEEQKSNGG